MQILVAVNTAIIKISAYLANHIRDLQGKCPNLAPVSTICSLVSTTFCIVSFLYRKDLVECSFFTNLKFADETQILDTYSETFL
jgi:hypothetical protein